MQGGADLAWYTQGMVRARRQLSFRTIAYAALLTVGIIWFSYLLWGILQKEERLSVLSCNNCRSRYFVTSIKTGFQAQVGKRAATRAKAT